MTSTPRSASSGQADYARTVPAEAFSAAGIQREAAQAQLVAGPSVASDTVSTDRAAEHTLRGISLTRRLLDYGYSPKRSTGERFRMRRMLGAGANGDVFAVDDCNLDREIAVKFLKGTAAPDLEAIDQFIEEAQITASLQHPNVLPVYEIDVNERGRVYFTMKKIEGRSLGDCLTASTSDRRDERIASFNQLVSIFINLGHALSYAHHRGIIHQDIKPDNIMIGDFGEILLVDWGSAVRLAAADRRLYGTPLYMSPEQARLEPSNHLTDVFCLGATLFHALSLRPAMWDDDEDEFWRKKRAGEIDAPSAAERAAVPAQLLDIAVKAMAANPAQRYVSVEDMVRDLERYQAGLAVSAHRDSLGEKLARWYRRNARAVWTGAAATAVSIALVAVLYGERLKEIATWGSPVVAETFDAGWKDRWQNIYGAFAVQGGRLVSTAPSESLMLWPERLVGDTAVEYDCEVLPGSQVGDLSMFWAPELPTANELARSTDFFAYHFLFGANGGAYTVISGPRGSQLAYDDIIPVVGKTHHVRIEIVGRRLSMAVDGRSVGVFDDLLPFTSGYVMLYSYRSGHVFDNVRIYSRGVAQKVPATAVGDSYLQGGEYAQAEAQYARVWKSHPSSSLGYEARYKQGLCAHLAKSYDRAATIWEGMRGHGWDEDIELQRLMKLSSDGRHLEVAAAIEAQFRRSDAAMRKRVVLQWSTAVGNLRYDILYSHADASGLAEYIAVRDRLFAQDHLADRSAAMGMILLQRFQEVLDRFPRQREPRQLALQYLGRDEQILSEFPDDQEVCVAALERMGRSDEAARRYDLPPSARAYGLILAGRLDEAQALDPQNQWAFLARGRFEEFVGKPGHEMLRRVGLLAGDQTILDRWKDEPINLIDAGRIDAAFEQRNRFGHEVVCLQAKALDEFIHDARADALGRLDACDPLVFHQYDPIWMFQFVALPFLHELAGESAAAHRSEVIAGNRFAFEQHPWYCARFLAGEISAAEFLAQPHPLHAPAQLAFCQAIRAEREGRRTDAVRSYREFLALPRWRRNLDLEPVVERFVGWRLQELGAP